MPETDPSSSEIQPSPVKLPPSAQEKKCSERFYCPYEGCNRSFAELWRLKVHYRASPDVRGSGKERGHGAELESCPKCGAELKPGRHHVGCAAGKSSTSQQQQQQRRRNNNTRSKKRNENPPSVSDHIPSSIEGNGTAIGVPVSWLPLDFDQFFIPIAHDSDPVFRRPRRYYSGMNLVYGNCGERPSMVTTQIGMEPDLDFSSFFNEEAPVAMNTFTTGFGPQFNQGGGVEKVEIDSSLSFGPSGNNYHHRQYSNLELPLESAPLFDDSSFENMINRLNDDGVEQTKENLSDSRKRDRGPSMDKQQQYMDKQKTKYIVPSLLNDDTIMNTSPPISALFESLEHPSTLSREFEDSSLSWKQNGGGGFHQFSMDYSSSLFPNGATTTTTTTSLGANQAMKSLTLEDENHFNALVHDLYGVDFQNSSIPDTSKGMNSQEEKIPN
eukprot:g2154.t1